MKLDDKLEDELVTRAEQIITAAYQGLKQMGEITGRTQASNAIEVAKATNSQKVFQNWLRYQKSRESFWRIRLDGSQDDIARKVNEAVEHIASRTTGAETMRMVARFLGYFKRALVAIEHFDQIPAAKEGSTQ